MKKTNYEVFLDTVEHVFSGCTFQHDKVTRELAPTILSTSDLLSHIEEPKNPYEMYLHQLPESFKRSVSSELYRAETGWLQRSKNRRRVLQYTHEGQSYLVPIFSEAAVGIDSSGLNESRIIVFAFYDNHGAAITYLENHLKIPRSKNPVEYKWNKLNEKNRQIIEKQFNVLLNMSCQGVFIVHTNLLDIFRKMNSNIFTNIIEGFFTGYNLDPVQNLIFRRELRRRFFEFVNNTPSHCDSDFLQLRPERVVRLLVRILSRYNDEPRLCTPLYAPVKSEESEPIQVTDLFAGVINNKISSEENPPNPFLPLYYNTKKLSKKYRERVFVRGYYWLREDG